MVVAVVIPVILLNSRRAIEGNTPPPPAATEKTCPDGSKPSPATGNYSPRLQHDKMYVPLQTLAPQQACEDGSTPDANGICQDGSTAQQPSTPPSNTPPAQY